MSLVLMGSSSGSVTLQEPAVAGSSVINLPVGTGTAVVNGVNSSLVSGTAQNSTSGTFIDFTGIPSWVKRITVMFNGVSTSGSSLTIMQIGSGSITTSGYTANRLGFVAGGGTFNTTTTSSFFVGSDQSSGNTYGHAVLTNVSGNTWVQSAVITPSATVGVLNTGAVTLSGVLDRVRITTQNGTDTFDAGSINILYE